MVLMELTAFFMANFWKAEGVGRSSLYNCLFLCVRSPFLFLVHDMYIWNGSWRLKPLENHWDSWRKGWWFQPNHHPTSCLQSFRVGLPKGQQVLVSRLMPSCSTSGSSTPSASPQPQMALTLQLHTWEALPKTRLKSLCCQILKTSKLM